MSAAESVKTIAKGLEIAQVLGQPAAKLIVAGGTYTEDINIHYGKYINLVILGDITISGYISVEKISALYIDGSYNFTLNGDFGIGRSSSVCVETQSWTQTGFIDVYINSCLRFACPVAITTSNHIGLHVVDNSSVFIYSTLSFTISNTDFIIHVSRFSKLYVSGNTTLTANNITSWICFVGNSASCVFDSNITCEGTSSYGGFLVSYLGYLLIQGKLIIPDILTGDNALKVEWHSAAWILGTGSVLNGATNLSVIGVTYESMLQIVGNQMELIGKGTSCVLMFMYGNCVFTGALKFTAPPEGCSQAFSANLGCAVGFGKLTVNGNYTSCVIYGLNNCAMYLNSSTAVDGNATGKRFELTRGSQFNVKGAGPNKIPGSVAGEANSSSFSYYG